jgi:dCTP deaminase
MSKKPGILTYQDIVKKKIVVCEVPIEDSQYQPASIDFRLGKVAYRVRSSFVPGNRTVEEVLDDLLMYSVDLDSNGILEKNQVYLVPLLESLCLPQQIHVKSNPKSTTGRLDIFSRMISDYSARFDEVQAGYCGILYLEIVPRSFTIRVKPGLSLSQLRFVQGDCVVVDQELSSFYQHEPLLYNSDDCPMSSDQVCIQDGLLMSVDLQGAQNDGVIGYKAKKNSDIIDLSKIGYYEIADFWDPIYRHKGDQLILEPEEFHLLCSQEKVRIPPDFSAEMVAYDTGAGEFRVHYAGFFDPGFGYGLGDIPGTYAVLEVRSHEVPYRIHHGQPFCKLRYTHNLEKPEFVYGTGVHSNYQHQRLSLSKHFKRK